MFDFEDLDHYELLGIARSAQADEVKRAYRREIAKYHPDRFVNATPEQSSYAVLRSQRINEAYRVLSDFSQRSSYSRKQPARTNQPAPPPQQRDHLAELYEQAQRHLVAERPLEAIAALRQLQQLNPLYRDSSELMAAAKAQLNQRNQRRESPRPVQSTATQGLPRRSMIIGGVSSVLAAAALAAWAFGRSPVAQSVQPSPNAVASEPTEAPVPTFVATAAPTATPTPLPTRTPVPTATPTPTSAPTVTSLPTAIPTEPLGELLLNETFDRRAWAQQNGQDWSVGYRDDRYRIVAERGVGLIWSYRTGPTGDASYAVDVQVNGEGGLLLRFASERQYLRCTVNSAGEFRVARARAGSLEILAEGFSQAINSGDQPSNRIEARLRGENIEFLANGQTLAEVVVADLSNSARYGLVVVAEDTTAEAFFDNLEIRAIAP
jgi:DnaJ domain